MTIRRCAYQRVGPSVDYPWEILAHEDCPWVIFATRTVRRCAYQPRWPFRGLSVGDFSPRLSVGDFSSCRVVDGHINAFRLSRTVVDAQDCWPFRGLSGDFPRGLSSMRISTLALPWTVRGTVVGDFTPTRTVRVDFRPRGLSSMRISTRWPFRGLSVGDFSPRGLSWVIFAYEDCRG
ncbi:hypothetical protein Bca4012_103189 [Brassica carinata]